MTVTLTGTLQRPVVDAPFDNVLIVFTARAPLSAVPPAASSEISTDDAGQYAVELNYGIYDIGIRINRGPVNWIARRVRIAENTSASDINALLVAHDAESNITPPIIVELEAIAHQARESANAAQSAARDAADDSQATALDRQSAGQSAATASAAAEQSASDAARARADANAAAKGRQAADSAAERAVAAATELEELIIENNALRSVVAYHHGHPLLLDGERF